MTNKWLAGVFLGATCIAGCTTNNQQDQDVRTADFETSANFSTLYFTRANASPQDVIRKNAEESCLKQYQKIEGTAPLNCAFSFNTVTNTDGVHLLRPNLVAVSELSGNAIVNCSSTLLTKTKLCTTQDVQFRLQM